METATLNLLLADEVNDWDPFRLGGGFYDTEIADIVAAVHELDSVAELTRRIQDIFEFSFEEKLPLDECRKAASRMLVLKTESSCEI
jgi:Domain of unknown function (DUF1871)